MVSRSPENENENSWDSSSQLSSVDGLNLESHKESAETSVVPYHGEELKPWNKETRGDIRSGISPAVRVTLRWILSAGVALLAFYVAINHVNMQRPPFSYILPERQPSTPEDTFSPDYSKLILLQSQLQRAMETSTSTIGVAIDLKRSEVAVRDLVTLVKISDLVTKDRLTTNLQQFVEDAKSTGRNLQKFGSQVGSVVDQTIGMNEYTIGLLQSAAASSSKALSLSPEREEIKKMWFEAIGTMKSNVGDLIVKAVANLQSLNRLEGELSTINEMSAREDRRVSADKVETLNELWTFLGGNKGRLAQFENHSELLNNVMNYRKLAADQVAGALFQLERLEQDLQDLNDQVTMPLLEKEVQIPLEVHIRTMQQGTMRLLEGRAREREREDSYIQKALGDR